MILERRPRIAVIGGGLGGLAATCTLAARGHDVLLLEANDWVGGKAALLEEGGFRFDMGPTILTVPSVLERIFAEAGKRVDEYLELIELDPQWRCFFEDGSRLDLCSDVDLMSNAIAELAGNPKAGAGYRRFIDWSEQLHGISERFFFWRPIGGIGDMFNMRQSFDLNVLKDVLSMRMGKSVAQTVRSHIPDERTAQMIDHFTQYIGSAPDASPAILCSIAHMQTSEGIWYPRGGTRAVPEALAKLALELGAEIRTGAEVTRILTNAGRVTAVELEGGETIPVSAVVSNSDAVRTHRELLGGRPARAFEKRRKYEAACSGVVLYLGLRERYDHLLHHNFVFSRDPEEEFDAIYRKGEPAPDPTCYLASTAATEPEVAPEGGDALYVLVHTPYLRSHHDWKEMLPNDRKVIFEKLARTAGLDDLEKRIVFEDALTPQDIHDRYRVLDGAIYGIASHGKYIGAFKPNNRSQDVDGLYLAGGAAHPGPGMPMVMMSGWIAADALDQDCADITALAGR